MTNLKPVLCKWLNLIAPFVCAGCGEVMDNDSNIFCSRCSSQVKLISEPLCPICGKPFKTGISHLCGECLQKSPFFTAARSLFFYKGPIKEAITKFKFKEMPSLASFWAKSIAIYLKDFISYAQPQMICPVPLHLERLRKRGYNQCWFVAKELSKLTGIPAQSYALKKVRPSRPQVGLSSIQRTQNVHNCFKATGVKDKRILLIDDVYTTGSTVNECAKALKKAGASKVFVITIARAMR